MEQQLYELPEGWGWFDMLSISNLITDGTHHSPKIQHAEYKKGRFKYITSKHVKNHGLNLENLTYIDQEVHDEIFSRCNPEYLDQLITKDGAMTGTCCLNSLKEPFSLLSSVALVKQKRNLVSPVFLNHYLQSGIGQEFLLGDISGAAITRTNLKKLKTTPIPLPPLNEQKRIVTRLDALFTRIDTAITHLRETLELTKALFASALDEIFEQAAQDADAKLIEEIFAISSGDGLTQKQMVKDGGYDVYGGNGITGRHNDFNRSGTNIVIGRVGAWCGNVRLVEGDIWVTDNAFFVKSYLADVFAPYLVVVLQYLDLRKTANQAAQPVISYKGIRELLIPLPSIGEQKLIVTHLDALSERTRALEAATEEKLNDLTALKASLLDAAFRGQL